MPFFVYLLKSLKKGLRRIKRVLDRILGTKANEFYWGLYYIFYNPSKYIVSATKIEGINHPHREFLSNIILSHRPFKNVLEVGCGIASNLINLSKKSPGTNFYGFDISKKAIKIGKQYLERENIKNIALYQGRANNLKMFKNKSIDIVFTDGLLMYIGPDKINQTLKELIRVAKNFIILCEQHTNSPNSLYKDKWFHNYKLLFDALLPNKIIKVEKIKDNFWADENWIRYGVIVEVYLK